MDAFSNSGACVRVHSLIALATHSLHLHSDKIELRVFSLGCKVYLRPVCQSYLAATDSCNFLNRFSLSSATSTPRLDLATPSLFPPSASSPGGKGMLPLPLLRQSSERISYRDRAADSISFTLFARLKCKNLSTDFAAQLEWAE